MKSEGGVLEYITGERTSVGQAQIQKVDQGMDAKVDLSQLLCRVEYLSVPTFGEIQEHDQPICCRLGPRANPAFRFLALHHSRFFTLLEVGQSYYDN